MEISNASFARVYPIWLYVFHVLLPLAAGGGIYSCYRSPSLSMFKWYAAIGIDNWISMARSGAAPFRHILPDWTIYSLPDGLWVYSLTSFMLMVWRRQNASRMSFIWPHIGVTLGLGSEVLQLTGTIPGAFDFVDALLCVALYALAFILLRRRPGQNKFQPGPDNNESGRNEK
jgi:hypothetical protein